MRFHDTFVVKSHEILKRTTFLIKNSRHSGLAILNMREKHTKEFFGTKRHSNGHGNVTRIKEALYLK